MTTVSNETRKTVADGLRRAADLADDAGDYGADLTETAVTAVTGIGKGMVRVPASFLRMVANIADGGKE